MLRFLLLPFAALAFAMPAGAETPRACGQAVPEDQLAEGPVACTCSADATQDGTIWGTDIYTTDSAICRAALHAGAVTEQGGVVTALPAPGRQSYEASARNGVESTAYGPWQSSFRFARQGELTADQLALAGSRCPPALANDDPALAANQPLTCSCPAQAAGTARQVWGTLIYTTDSAICAAALHAGAIDRRGGQVTIIPMPGRRAYRGEERNGITSGAYGEWQASFRFAGVAPPDPSICPDVIAERNDNATGKLACTCPAEQTRRGSVWGTGTYTADSALCRAALHAGAVTRAGGRITVVPAPGESAYAGSTRNGVASDAWQAWDESFRFEGVAVAPAAPVQAPVAHALKTTGEVSLYIQFRTNSAEIDPSGVAMLTELRDALRSDAGLRVRLVGHTDNQGGPATNRPLSQRRAEAVRNWLVANGIEAGRLAAEGRGQDQPVAENTNDAGRALNRRVQAVRVN